MKIFAILPTILAVDIAAANDLSRCLTIDTDLDRLGCYDKEAGRAPTVENSRPSGRWGVRVEKSEFKDTTDVFMSVASEGPINCGRISGPAYAQLYIRCRENTTAVYLSTQCHLASSQYNSYGDVDIRIDEKATRTLSMDSSTSNDSLGFWSGGKAIPLIKSMLDGDVMLARFTPYGESAVTARFEISGISEAIKPLRESCGW